MTCHLPLGEEIAYVGLMRLDRWKVLQAAIFVAFLFSNVYFDWGIEGIAASVMGGMLAYYVTRIILALLDSRQARDQQAPPEPLPVLGRGQQALAPSDYRDTRVLDVKASRDPP